MKRQWTALVCAAMMLGSSIPAAVPMTAFAEDEVETSGQCGEFVTWNFDSATGTLTISGTGEMEDHYNQPWERFSKEIVNVSLSEGLTNIGQNTCNGDVNLKEIKLPSTVTKIGSGAFWGTAITTIDLPAGLTEIGSEAFYECKELTEVSVPSGVTELKETFKSCSALTSVTLSDGLETIGLNAFGGCTSLTEITIPDSVTMIDSYAFQNSGLTSVTIPGSVEDIRDWSFNGCKALESVTIGEGVKTIGASFQSCASLTEITFPASVESLGGDLLDGCKALTDVTILNPECKLGGFDRLWNTYTFDFPDGTIHGYEGSTAQTFAETNSYHFDNLGAAPEPAADVLLGDVNLDGKVDASDAADLLIALANVGAGAESGLTDAQTAAADADGNGALNAGDAATILQYAAFIGAGGTGTLTDFLKAE